MIRFRREKLKTALLAVPVFAAASMVASPQAEALAVNPYVNQTPTTLDFDFCVIPAQGSDANEAAIGEAQLKLTITDLMNGMASFTFTNTGTQDASVTRIYFENDANSLGSVDSTSMSAGVDLRLNTGPGPNNVPAGNELTPAFDADLRFKAKASPSQNGIRPGEFFTAVFNLTTDFAALENAFYNTDNDRIALHVQSIGQTDGSESFFAKPGGKTNVIPTPSAVGLGLGLIGLASARRRRQSQD